jgi:probable rRNA maturation factor
MLAALDLAKAELSVALTNDEEIHELNRVFRHKDRPTDVLAFAMREGEIVGAGGDAHSPEILGDVVISVETAREQAKKRRRPLEAEVRMLLAHGVLHLIGYDHQNDRDEALMSAKTRVLCRAALVDRAPRKSTARAARTSKARAPRTSKTKVPRKSAARAPRTSKALVRKVKKKSVRRRR